jgi:DNA-binding HxlR family transcriptional regulator
MDRTAENPAAPAGIDTPAAKHASECPVEEWLAFLGHRWNALILWHLQTGPKRQGELVGRLAGIRPKVLTERLDGLEQRGLVSRELLASFPRGVLYTLSARGQSLVLVLDRLEMWAKAGAVHEPTD